jgi:hypothetical protein
MRKWAVLLAVCAVAVVASGCYAGIYTAPVKPGLGLMFARVNAPISVDYNAAVVSTKTGEATAENILGLIEIGDCSAEAAARNGGLTKIHYLDYKFENILGVYSKFTTIAHGE